MAHSKRIEQIARRGACLTHKEALTGPAPSADATTAVAAAPTRYGFVFDGFVIVRADGSYLQDILHPEIADEIYGLPKRATWTHQVTVALGFYERERAQMFADLRAVQGTVAERYDHGRFVDHATINGRYCEWWTRDAVLVRWGRWPESRPSLRLGVGDESEHTVCRI